MAKPQSRRELREHCLRTLGKPVIDINVDEDQLEDRIDDALQYFSEYHFDGVERVYDQHQITAADVTNQYIAVPDPVVSVTRVLPISDASTINMFDVRYQLRLNEFYDWHQDSTPFPFKDVHPNFEGKIRKLSSIINLSKPSDYEGGDLEFDFRNLTKESSNIKVCDQIKEQGSIVVFPSFIHHRVTPITKGTRHSLVSWTVGYPWK